MTALASAPDVVNHDRKSLEIHGLRPDIQGIRAIAVGMVVLYQANKILAGEP
jgi:peptidoglycan/LPS O-acetylase OafA/YrhL